MLMLIAGGSLAAGSDDRILAPMPLGAVHPSYLVHVAGYNLGLIMRLLTGAGTPREFRALAVAHLAAAITPTGGLFLLLIIATDDQTAALALSIEPDHCG
jgi:transposase